MNNKPEKLVLDYSKWRCGGDGENKLGEGPVALCNSLGFMCCLGQWSLQIGADENAIMDKGEPQEASIVNPLLTIYDGECLHASTFSSEAIGINDDDTTTPEYKINKLRELCLIEGVKLEVTNQPLTS
jgi:hypothetical protein